MQQQIDEQMLTAYVVGELSAEERSLVEKHLGENEEARRMVKEIRGTTGAINSVFGAEPPIEYERVMRIPVERRNWLRIGVAVAACAAIGVASIRLLSKSSSEVTTRQNNESRQTIVRQGVQPGQMPVIVVPTESIPSRGNDDVNLVVDSVSQSKREKMVKLGGVLSLAPLGTTQQSPTTMPTITILAPGASSYDPKTNTITVQMKDGKSVRMKMLLNQLNQYPAPSRGAEDPIQVEPGVSAAPYSPGPSSDRDQPTTQESH